MLPSDPCSITLFMEQWMNHLAEHFGVHRPPDPLMLDVVGDKVTMREFPEVDISGSLVDEIRADANGENKSYSVTVSGIVPDIKETPVDENGLITLSITFNAEVPDGEKAKD